jgi:hypothetical protein
MKELKISIYKEDSKLVPKKAREKLAKKGIDIEKIIKTIEKEKTHGKLLEIQDKEDHIIISVE